MKDRPAKENRWFIPSFLIPLIFNSYSGRKLKRQAKEVGLKNQEREVTRTYSVHRIRVRTQKAMNEDEDSMKNAYCENERWKKKTTSYMEKENTENERNETMNSLIPTN